VSDCASVFDGSVACASAIRLVGVVADTSRRGRWRVLGPFRGSGDHGRVAERSAGWWWGLLAAVVSRSQPEACRVCETRRGVRRPTARCPVGGASRDGRRTRAELISDRVWRSQAQLELATVKWVAWFNHDRLHSSLGDIPPVEFEHHHAAAIALDPSISLNGSVATISPKPANGLTTRRLATVGVDCVAPAQVASSSALVVPSGVSAQAAPTAVNRPSTACGLSDLRLRNILADRTFQLLTNTTTHPT
jgi:hypothetical protein